MEKNLTYSGELHRKYKKDPYSNIVRKNLKTLLEGEDKEVIIENLKKVGRSYTKNSYGHVLRKGSMSVRAFLQFMRAVNKKEFTLTISSEDLELLLEHDKKQEESKIENNN